MKLLKLFIFVTDNSSCFVLEFFVCPLWFLGVSFSATWIQHTQPYAIWKPVSKNVSLLYSIAKLKIVILLSTQL